LVFPSSKKVLNFENTAQQSIMVAFKIELEEQLVQLFGYAEIE
jgi:hypothetical protein